MTALRRIFASTPKMARHVLPLLLGKLTDQPAPPSETKQELFSTLCHSAASYDASVMSPYLEALAGALYKEVTTGEDDIVVNGALEASSKLFKVTVMANTARVARARSDFYGPQRRLVARSLN